MFRMKINYKFFKNKKNEEKKKSQICGSWEIWAILEDSSFQPAGLLHNQRSNKDKKKCYHLLSYNNHPMI